ncbi:MAG: hypothetical protein EOP19_21890 [Hyphomicrobiales bacterium]|nr:MAG: hypothetical protein EOP19_21890 [Hyphomicrobiales bacterium]
MMKTASVLALLLAALSVTPAAQAASFSFNGLGAKPPITATPMAGVKPPVHVPMLINLPDNPPGSGGWDEPSDPPSDEPSDAPDSHDDPSDPPGGSGGGENTDPPGGNDTTPKP